MEEAKRTHQLASQFEPEIDSLFRPLAPSIPDEPSFNNYNFSKGGKDVKQRLDDVKLLRDNEAYISKKPTTPLSESPEETKGVKPSSS
jgi:hypothetical protein